MEPEARVWYNSDNKRQTDAEVFAWLRDRIAKGTPGATQVIVGTDSQMHGRTFRFVTALAVYTPGRGGDYRLNFAFEDRVQFRGNQQARMFDEASRSIAFATEVMEKLDVVPVIHVDASPADMGEFTSTFSDAIKGYVTSYGFECSLKPAGWVASCVADRHSK